MAPILQRFRYRAVLAAAGRQEVVVVIDPTTARNDRLRETERWGYTGDMPEDFAPVEDNEGRAKWIWVALLALLIVAIVAIVGPTV